MSLLPSCSWSHVSLSINLSLWDTLWKTIDDIVSTVPFHGGKVKTWRWLWRPPPLVSPGRSPSGTPHRGLAVFTFKPSNLSWWLVRCQILLSLMEASGTLFSQQGRICCGFIWLGQRTRVPLFEPGTWRPEKTLEESQVCSTQFFDAYFSIFYCVTG